MTYGYEIIGKLKGVQVIEDTTYSYNKKDGLKEPKLILQPFEFYTKVLVDSRGDRALQSIYKDENR